MRNHGPCEVARELQWLASMVTMSEIPTLPGWQSRRRRSSSGVWIIDDADPTQPTLVDSRDLILSDEVATLPRACRARSGKTVGSAGAPPPRLIPLDLGAEPVTLPMARRPREPVLDRPIVDGDEVPTFEMVAPPEPRESDIVELISVDEDDEEIATLPLAEESVFDLDSLLSDVDSFESGPAFPSAACSWPTRVEAQPTSASPASFPGRPFGSALAPTSQTDRPEGPSVGARAVSVLVAVAVISLVLLAAAMMVTDKSGIEAFMELHSLIELP